MACGGRTSGAEGGDGDGSSTDPTDTGESGSGDTGDTEDSEDSGEETGGDGCEQFETQDPEGPPTQIVIVNDGDDPIFVSSPGLCEQGYFRLEGDTGFYADTGGCTTRCDAEGCGACPPVCIEPNAIRINPKGFYTIDWDGRYFEAADQPLECTHDPSCAGNCSVLKPTPPGEYVFTAGGYDSSICGNGDACDCSPNPDGWCETTASSDNFPIFEVSEVVMLPTDGQIVLVLP